MKRLLLFLTLACGVHIAPRSYSQVALTWNTIEGIPDVFFQPYGVATDSAGNVLVADTLNDVVRQLTPSGPAWVLSTVAGSISGFADGTNTDAQFDYPAAVAAGPAGTLYVADFFNNAVRKLVRVSSDWVVTTIAGNGSPGSANGPGDNAQFDHPTGIAVDGAGNVYVADQGNNTLRKLSLTGGSWVVSTMAGMAGSSGTADGTNTAARFASPWGVTVDGGGVLYVSDFASSRIRQVRPVGSDWVVTTIAGSSPGFNDGTGATARFNYPMGITSDSAGTLYVADFYNALIRRIVPTGTNWITTTIGGDPGVNGYADGSGANARFSMPRGIAAGTQGRLFVADTGNNSIRIGTAGLFVQIAVAGNQLVLTCPSAATNFVLETRATLSAATWAVVTNGITVSGPAFILPNQEASAGAFFRLRSNK